jgi:hypothetical protein
MSRMTQADVDAHRRRFKAPSGSPSGSGGTPRAPKYRAVPTVQDGIRFDSKSEAQHYARLKLLEAAGLISDLRCHQRWPLVVNGVDCGAYESDYDYLQDGQHMIVDLKGAITDLYAFKKRVFEAVYPFRITEIRKSPRQPRT